VWPCAVSHGAQVRVVRCACALALVELCLLCAFFAHTNYIPLLSRTPEQPQGRYQRSAEVCACLGFACSVVPVARLSAHLRQGAVPVAILKLPRTGSSWVTQELNALPSVFLSKEIIQQGDVGRFTAEEVRLAGAQIHLQANNVRSSLYTHVRR
jgi:hypothetical protein